MVSWGPKAAITNGRQPYYAYSRNIAVLSTHRVISVKLDFVSYINVISTFLPTVHNKVMNAVMLSC